MSTREVENIDEEHLPSEAFSAQLKTFTYDDSSTSNGHSSLQRPSSALSAVVAKSEERPSLPQASKRKHVASASSPDSTASSTPPKRRTTTRERSANDPYEPENRLIDSLRTGLMLVFIGLNPGLETARTGHAYAHATNQFWPLLHNSGITPVRHKAADTHLMPELYNIGNTNLCKRATRAGDGLSKQEQVEGVQVIENKVKLYKPDAVCIVGKGIWDTIYKYKTGKTLPRQEFSYGWQDERLWIGRTVDKAGIVTWDGARTFVCTSTSGLAADTKPAEKLAIMSKLGDWVKQQREELKIASDRRREVKIEP